MIRTFCYIFLLVCFAGLAISLNNGCSSNPVGTTEAYTPHTSEEGEQLYLTDMRNRGKAVSLPYCWWWVGYNGEVHTACRWESGVLVGGQ